MRGMLVYKNSLAFALGPTSGSAIASPSFGILLM